jgi:subtilisin family serine protease
MKNILLTLALCPFLGFAQTPVQIQELLNLSQFLFERSETKRQDALNRAQGLRLQTRVETPEGQVRELMEFEGNLPVFYTTHNLNAARSIATNQIQSGGSANLTLTGSTDTLGIWDEGIARPTHQEFGTRVIVGDGSNTISNHGTHVGGTMAASGNDANAKGMSPSALLKTYNWNNDLSEMSSAAAAGMYVSNHSYGYLLGWYWDNGNWQWAGNSSISNSQDYRFGFYNAESQYIDYIANLAPYYTICFAAGNDRGDGPTGQTAQIDGGADGFDCIGPTGTPKNILTIGAVNDLSSGYTGVGSVVMTSFSGWGPTDDGRIKPDLVANGTTLYSPTGTANNAYSSLSGTSMATPSVSGSIGLLLQHQRNLFGNVVMRSSTLKALLIHTADEAGNTGPDYKFGWGLPNFRRAVDLMTTSATTSYNIQEFELNQGDSIEIPVLKDASQTLKVTIAWNDPYGPVPAASLNPTTQILVNDLDLRIEADTSSFKPWVLNPASPNTSATTGDNTRDNVEQVVVSNSQERFYSIKIKHKGTLLGGSQIVSVIISGNKSINTNLAINNQTISGNTSFVVTDSISSNATIQNTANVTFIAGNSITLKPNFNVKPGGIFSASIEDWSGSFFGARKLNTLYPEFIYERSVADFAPITPQSKPTNLFLSNTISENTFTVFPNPTKGRSQLKFDGLPTKILITDGLGNIISTLENQEIYESLEIDFSNYPSGIYFVKAFYNQASSVQKIVKF